MSRDGFAAAQRAYENAEPPDWAGVSTEARDCEEVTTRTVTNSLGFEEDVDEECDFSGKVDVYYTKTTEQFTCPKCGKDTIRDL